MDSKKFFLNLVLVGTGGTIGALLRFSVYYAFRVFAVSQVGAATLAVNVSGSFALGLLFALIGHQNIEHHLVYFLGVGVLGAFTTFSTFSLETVLLIQSQLYLQAAYNVLLNVMLSMGALAIGLVLKSTH